MKNCLYCKNLKLSDDKDEMIFECKICIGIIIINNSTLDGIRSKFAKANECEHYEDLEPFKIEQSEYEDVM